LSVAARFNVSGILHGSVSELNNDEIQKLCRAVELGFERMKVARDARYKFLAQYVGPFYSEEQGRRRQRRTQGEPINLMYKAVTTLVPNLVYNDPRVKVQTEVLALPPVRRHAGTRLQPRHRGRFTPRHAAQGDHRRAVRRGFIKTGIAAAGQTLDLDGKGMDIRRAVRRRG
jgi:hypothetical protein